MLGNCSYPREARQSHCLNELAQELEFKKGHIKIVDGFRNKTAAQTHDKQGIHEQITPATSGRAAPSPPGNIF